MAAAWTWCWGAVYSTEPECGCDLEDTMAAAKILGEKSLGYISAHCLRVDQRYTNSVYIYIKYKFCIDNGYVKNFCFAAVGCQVHLYQSDSRGAHSWAEGGGREGFDITAQHLKLQVLLGNLKGLLHSFSLRARIGDFPGESMTFQGLLWQNETGS